MQVAIEDRQQLYDPGPSKVDKRPLASVLHHLVGQHLPELDEAEQLGFGAAA